MAKGVLCFFHGICYEDDSLVDDNADNNAGTRAKRVTTDITDGPALTVYPNPADVYLLRVTDADGKEYHRKIVRR